MKQIIRITVKSESGYGSIEDAYQDKIVITRDSIRYKYKPQMESEKHSGLKWSYKASSLAFQGLFNELALKIRHVMSRDEDDSVTDIGATTFVITYVDKTKEERIFFLPGDEFGEAFSIIKKMIPGCETVPEVLWMSSDSAEV